MADLKSAVRMRIRAARRGLDDSRRRAEAAAACTALAGLLRRVPAAAVAAYMAMPGELDLAPLLAGLWADGRPVWLPRVAAPGLLSWHPVRDPAGLRPGAFGISEPDPAAVPAGSLPMDAVLIVPGVAFDRQGRRLGQGGGFYDRLIAGRRSLGVGFRCQLVEDLPCEEHDLPVSGLLIAGELILPPPWA